MATDPLNLRRQQRVNRAAPDYELQMSPHGTHRVWYNQTAGTPAQTAAPATAPQQPGQRGSRRDRLAHYQQRYGQQQQAGPTQAETLAAEYQRAYDEARAANEQRYLDILEGYGDMRREATGYLEGLGQRAEQDIRRGWGSQQEAAMQDLTSRGLRGTTVAPTTAMGFQRGMQSDLGQLRESLAQQYLGATMPIDQQRLGFMERREDAYPDFNQMLQLQQGLGGAAAYGGAGSPSPSLPPTGAPGPTPASPPGAPPSAGITGRGYGGARPMQGYQGPGWPEQDWARMQRYRGGQPTPGEHTGLRRRS